MLLRGKRVYCVTKYYNLKCLKPVGIKVTNISVVSCFKLFYSTYVCFETFKIIKGYNHFLFLFFFFVNYSNEKYSI